MHIENQSQANNKTQERDAAIQIITSKVKFQKFYVTNGIEKARVFYSLDNRTDGRPCVTIYDKDYGHALGRIFSGDEYQNDTDTMTDYFDKGTVRLFEGHPLYAAARQRAEAIAAARAVKFGARN